MEKQQNKDTKKKHAGGRPTKYTKELGEKICEIVSKTPKSLEITTEENEEFPHVATIYAWMHKHEEFHESMIRAQKKQCVAFENELINIACSDKDDFYFNGKLTCVNSGKIQRDTLKINTIQRVLSYRSERYRNNAQIKVEGSLMTAVGLTTNELKNNARALIKECSKNKE